MNTTCDKISRRIEEYLEGSGLSLATIPGDLLEVITLRAKLSLLEDQVFEFNELMFFHFYDRLKWVPIDDCCCGSLSDCSTRASRCSATDELEGESEASIN